jgi:hypothetical protein
MKWRQLYLVLFLLACPLFLSAQKIFGRDSLPRVKRSLNYAIGLISTHPNDTILNQRSEDYFARFTGKIVRTINIDHVGFEKSIYDSSRRVKRVITKLANQLHTDSRQRTIREHVFIRPGKPLNPHLLADNERYIRARDFILDCRIIVTPIPETDSVDLTVFTRDVFSFGASAAGSFPNAPQLGVFDANFLGRAQRLEFTTLFEESRHPSLGLATQYRKSSLFGSLIDMQLEYTQLDHEASIGSEKEYRAALRLTRPLASPYSRWAGGFELSNNWSKNLYRKPDSLFLDYDYRVIDGWVGYNIGVNKAVQDRGRHFVAFRYFDGYFENQPDQEIYREQRLYNNSSGYLGQVTFYKQNFYKTRYIYGFGRTEDVPSGFSLSVTGGYVRFLGMERPYAAVSYSLSRASRRGNIYRLDWQSEGYYSQGRFEDVVFIAGATYQTRAANLDHSKIRNKIGLTYTQILKRTTSDWLTITRQQIPGFHTDSLQSSKRLAFHWESTLYTNVDLAGFRLAPFLAGDVTVVDCIRCPDRHSFYSGITAGIRFRNENLIFGTVELRFTFIPRDEYGKQRFDFGAKNNLRLIYTGTFVQPPALLTY